MEMASSWITLHPEAVLLPIEEAAALGHLIAQMELGEFLFEPEMSLISSETSQNRDETTGALSSLEREEKKR
jgi:hypothetical protein